MFQELLENIRNIFEEFYLTANDFFSSIHGNPCANYCINTDDSIDYETIYFEKPIDNDFEEDFEEDFNFYSNLIKNMMLTNEEKDD